MTTSIPGKPLLDRAAIVASVSIIQDKLQRVRRYIVETYAVNGALDADHQFTIRVLDAAKRNLERQVLILTRPATDNDRQSAWVELYDLSRRDVGDIFRWLVKNHAYGRFGCPGCEYDYKTEHLTPGGLPSRIPITKLCSRCRMGIMHSQGVESREEVSLAFSLFQEAVGRVWVGEARPPVYGEDVAAILLVCEACCYWEIRPC